MLNANETAYRVLVQNDNEIWSNLQKMFNKLTAIADVKIWKKFTTVLQQLARLLPTFETFEKNVKAYLIGS